MLATESTDQHSPYAERLVLVLLPHDVRLILRKKYERYLFHAWKRAVSAAPDPLFDWEFKALLDRDLMRRSFGSVEEAARVFTRELECLRPIRRSG